MSRFGNGCNICDAVKETVDMVSNLTENCDECARDDAISAVKELGYQWVKANETNCVLIEKLKDATGLKDTDIQSWLPMFRMADISTAKKWEDAFGQEED